MFDTTKEEIEVDDTDNAEVELDVFQETI